MNVGMATNAQLSTTKSEKQTKQISRIEINSQKWRSHGGLSAGRGKGENRGKGTGMRSIIGRYRTDRGRTKRSVSTWAKGKEAHRLVRGRGEK